MNQEQIKQLIALVDEYCVSYGINRKDLFTPSGTKKKKVKGLVSLSTMRMALGHYIYQKYPLTLNHIAQIIGYSDHSSMCYHYRKIRAYIKADDRIFMSYYNNLLEIAKNYPLPVKIMRVHQSNYLILSK